MISLTKNPGKGKGGGVVKLSLGRGFAQRHSNPCSVYEKLSPKFVPRS